MSNLNLETFFDEPTFTLTYVVWDASTKDAVIIDPVRDYDPLGSVVSFESSEKVARFIGENGLIPRYVLETHAHADHLSGAPFFKERFGAKVAIGEHITAVQEVFKGVFNLGSDFKTDGSQFDALLGDGEVLKAGSLKVKTIHTPGHTPACSSYLIGNMLFTGDALFMPDFGVGRCDFPKGDAGALYDSVHGKLYKLADDTRVFVGHDYMPGGREVAWETTIGESKKSNIQLKWEDSREDFVAKRTARDKTLKAPRLIYQSVQVNIDAGALPAPEENGMRYLKMPIKML